jgi:hypothetical protein
VTEPPFKLPSGEAGISENIPPAGENQVGIVVNAAARYRAPVAGGKFARRVWCDRCGIEVLAELQRYPRNNGVVLRCLSCDGIIRQEGKIFIPHRSLRALDYDIAALPEVSR